jgi:nucleotide-binding universal stress UspA family protein
MAGHEPVPTAVERFVRALSENERPGSAQTDEAPGGTAPPGGARPEVKQELLSQAKAWTSGRGIKKILAAVDHADHPAIESALALAKPFGAEVIIVLVLDPMLGVVSEAGHIAPSTIENMRSQARELLDVITKRLPENALAFTYLLEGSPANEIVQTAKDFDSDLIVMGTHRRGGLKRFFLGSVSQAVIRKAPCPVLLVSETAPAASEEVPLHA